MHFSGTGELNGQFDWSCIHVFWGGERCVPPDHLDRLPAQIVKPDGARPLRMVDEAATSLL